MGSDPETPGDLSGPQVPSRATRPIDLIQAAQEAVARALTQARGDDHSRLLRAGLALVQAGQALDPKYARDAGTRRTP
jgi:hypothetical protein